MNTCNRKLIKQSEINLVGGWVDGWMGVKVVQRIVTKSNQKSNILEEKSASKLLKALKWDRGKKR